jgi:hypothetical protein
VTQNGNLSLDGFIDLLADRLGVKVVVPQSSNRRLVNVRCAAA